MTNNTCDKLIWQVSVTVDGSIDNLWSGEYTGGNGTIQVKGVGWNSELAVGQSTTFGFCANRDQKPVTYQCSDGIDNDGDGLVDLSDPGCASAEDNDETNETPPATQCSDGVDNDGDGLIDLSDPGCANAEDNDETNGSCGEVEATTTIRDDWGDGYCADVTVTNNTCEKVTWQVNVTVDGSIDNLWSGEYTGVTGPSRLRELAGIRSWRWVNPRPSVSVPTGSRNLSPTNAAMVLIMTETVWLIWPIRVAKMPRTTMNITNRPRRPSAAMGLTMTGTAWWICKTPGAPMLKTMTKPTGLRQR